MPTLTTLVDGTIPVAADFNGNYQALNNAIGSSTSISAWAIGEMPYASGTNQLARLSPGTVGQVLTMGTSVPAWGAVGPVGGCFLSNNVSDATNDIDISVGARWSDDATFTSRNYIYLSSAITKRLDANWAVGTNQGGLDTGSIANGTYHVFVIMRTDTGVVDVLFSTSASSPTMPTSYNKKWRIGSILRESAAIVAFVQNQDLFLRNATSLDFDNATPGTSANTVTLKVPVGIIVQARVNALQSNGMAALYLSALAVSDETPSGTAAPLGTTANGANSSAVQADVLTNTSGQIRARASANLPVKIATLGWIDKAAVGNG